MRKERKTKRMKEVAKERDNEEQNRHGKVTRPSIMFIEDAVHMETHLYCSPSFLTFGTSFLNCVNNGEVVAANIPIWYLRLFNGRNICAVGDCSYKISHSLITSAAFDNTMAGQKSRFSFHRLSHSLLSSPHAKYA